MKKKFRLVFGDSGCAKAIRYGKQYVVLLNEGTYINEIYLGWILDLLNGKETLMPNHKDKERC